MGEEKTTEVTFTKDEFDHAVYPAVVRQVPGKLARLVGKVLDKLEERATIKGEGVDWRELASGRVPLAKLDNDAETFGFTDPECAAIAHQLHAFAAELPGGYAREVMRLAERVEDRV